jgi:hypothetical protein
MELTRTHKIIAGAVAALVLASAAFGVVRLAAAQEDDNGATPPAQQRGDEFIDRLAQKLGVDATQLQQAIRDTQLELVDEALAEGRVTDEQAQKARERIESGKGPAFGKFKDRGSRGHGPPGHAYGKALMGMKEVAAVALGMTEDELEAELDAGKSIADVAAERGLPLDNVKSAILDAARARLDTAVNNGRLDRARADQMLDQLSARLDDALHKRKAPDTEPDAEPDPTP